jgi:deazaflavin-dependent oxidoreductase (nitroreductase family)
MLEVERGARGVGAPDLIPYVRAFRGQSEKSGYDRFAQAFAKTRLGGFLFITVFPAIDKRLMPLTGGRLRVAMGQPILLLHTLGAKSGRPRVVPLLYTPYRDAFVIVASKAGAERHPSWYHNLLAHPDAVEVESDGRRFPVTPRVVEGDERERLWDLVNDNYNGYQTYQHRAGGRVIPVVVLEPKGGD